MNVWGPRDVIRWWNVIECDGLFLEFDTSAHVNGGEPNVSASSVVEHIRGCEQCQDAGHAVAEDSEGILTLNPF